MRKRMGVFIAISVLTLPWYAICALVLARRPATPAAASGFVAVVADKSALERFYVDFSTDTGGWQEYRGVAPEDRLRELRSDAPRVSIRLAMCSPYGEAKPFHVGLILAGNARVIDPEVTGPSPPEVTEHTAKAGRLDRRSRAPVGSVQLISTYTTPADCNERAFSPGRPSIGYSTLEITGRLVRPLVSRSKLLFVEGPRWTAAWPTVGEIPLRVGRNELPADRVELEDGRTWLTQTVESAQVFTGGDLRITEEPEEIRPDTFTSESLSWTVTRDDTSGAVPTLHPQILVLDKESEASWQGWQIAAAIALGIGGSVLASALFEWGRRSPPG